MKRRVRGRLSWTLAGSVFVLALAVIIGAPFYIRPQTEPLQPADVIMVLGGHGFDRYEYGLQLANEGYASTVLLSAPGPDDPNTDPQASPDADNDGDRLADLCQRSYSFTVICFQPDPATTRGEARELRDESAAHGWTTAIVVTMTPHLSRARYIIDRCFTGDLKMVASPKQISPVYWAWSYLYQTGGFVRASLQDGC